MFVAILVFTERLGEALIIAAHILESSLPAPPSFRRPHQERGSRSIAGRVVLRTKVGAEQSRFSNSIPHSLALTAVAILTVSNANATASQVVRSSNAK